MISKSQENLPPRQAIGSNTSTRVTLAALLFSIASGSTAWAEVIVSRYDVSLAGLHLGDAILHTTLSPQHYKVAVSADVGILFVNRSFRGEASGSRAGAKLTPDHFRMVMSGGDDNAVDINFAEDSAPVAKITPPISARQLHNSVPLTEAHLRGVLDPLSALLLASLRSPSASGNPCHDVLPVFTGYARIDVSLHPAHGRDTEGGSSVVTCEVRYVSIAGHPRSGAHGRPQDFKLEIDFKRLSKPRLWLLQHLSLPTPIGTVTVERTETRAG
jgi:hypothetical protein